MVKMFTVLLTILSLAPAGFAQTHKGITFQAVIKTPDGSWPTLTNQSVRIKILSLTNCVLWEEVHSGVSVTDGFLTVPIGTGTTGGAHPAGQTFQKVFDNSTTQTGLTCYYSNGSVNAGFTSYVPADQDARKVRLEMTLPTGAIQADFNLRAIPFAISAESATKLGTKTEADVLAVNATAGVTQANVEAFMQSLISAPNSSVRWDGTNFVAYDPASGANFSAGSIPASAIDTVPWSKLTSVPSPLADIGALVCADGKILKKVAGVWACANESVPSELDPSVQAYAKSAPGTGLVVNGSNLLVPDFGTAAGKVAQGNDSRFPSATCAPGNQMRWDGTAWQCESEANPSTFVLNGGQAGAVTLGSSNANAVTVQANGSPRITVLSGGNVGVGTATPSAKLDVFGQIRGSSFNAGSSTTIDWANGNLQYTSANCGAITFSNMLDGGAYTLVVTGTAAATCTFSQSSPDSLVAGAFKFSPANANTAANAITTYSFLRYGSNVVVSWITGFQ